MPKKEPTKEKEVVNEPQSQEPESLTEQPVEQIEEPLQVDNAEGKDALVVAQEDHNERIEQASEPVNEVVEKYPTEPVEPYVGMHVAFWHDPQIVVEAEIKNLRVNGLVDLELTAPLFVIGINLGQIRLGVRHEYGSRTPGTWDYLFNTNLQPPKPQAISVHTSKDEVVDAGVVRNEQGKVEIVEK